MAETQCLRSASKQSFSKSTEGKVELPLCHVLLGLFGFIQIQYNEASAGNFKHEQKHITLHC